MIIFTENTIGEFSFMPYENKSVLYFKMKLNCEYCGDFKTIKDIRKEKLEKLKELENGR
jgi:hypothetical protein